MDNLSMITVSPQQNGRGITLGCSRCGEHVEYLSTQLDDAPTGVWLERVVLRAQRHVREIHSDARPHPTCLDVSPLNAAPGSAYVCGVGCPTPACKVQLEQSGTWPPHTVPPAGACDCPTRDACMRPGVYVREAHTGSGADLAEIRCVPDRRVHVGCDHDADREPLHASTLGTGTRTAGGGVPGVGGASAVREGGGVPDSWLHRAIEARRAQLHAEQERDAARGDAVLSCCARCGQPLDDVNCPTDCGCS